MHDMITAVAFDFLMVITPHYCKSRWGLVIFIAARISPSEPSAVSGDMDASSPTQRHLPSGSEARDARAFGLDPRGPPGRRRGGRTHRLGEAKGEDQEEQRVGGGEPDHARKAQMRAPRESYSGHRENEGRIENPTAAA
jgi:hypothetical protein